MKKFRINELTADSNSSNNSSGGQPQHHQQHGMRSPSSVSLASSSTSVNHQTPCDRLSLANNANIANLVHSSSSEPQRTNQFYHNENNFILSHNDNINWRDEADGSEEEECRLNLLLPSSSDVQPPPTNHLQSNLFGQHSSSTNLPTHQAPSFTTMVEQDLRSQGLNNNNSCPDITTRVANRSTDKNLDSNFKEKQLRETEFCINRIEDLLASFKNLWKTGDFEQQQQQHQQIDSEGGHVNNNINANMAASSSSWSSIARNPAQTMPKMTNNSNLSNHSQPNFLRVSNQFAGPPAISNLTIPKQNTHQQLNDSTEENLRNSKNSRKLFPNVPTNNRHTVQSDLQAHVHGTALNEMCDFNEPLFGDTAPESRIDQFYRLLNAQINTLHGRLEQLALAAENSKENYSQANPFNFNSGSVLPSAEHFPSSSLCENDNCCLAPPPPPPPPAAELHQPDDSSSTHLRKFNQQIYQLLMFQNYQINQQHKLIERWINAQQKWIEKQPGSVYKVDASHRHAPVCASTSHVNNMFLNGSPLINNCRHLRPDIITLNNQTEPRTRANNFLDNFRSHSHQNKLQSNRDIGASLSTTREQQQQPYVSGQHGGNCSNSCSNIGPCNKNSRSQSFAGFTNHTVKGPHSNNNFNLQANSNFSAAGPSGSSLPHALEKKLNTNVGNNLQQLNKILSMVGKMAETDSGAGTSISNLPAISRSQGNASASRLGYSPSYNTMSETSSSCSSSYKRKKMSNVNSAEPSLAQQALHEDICEFDNEDEDEDDHDSVDIETGSFEPAPRLNGNQSESSSGIFGAPGSTSAGAPTALPSFHMDKCSFQVPLTISPHTGAIRKKPIYDCNFKFAATDNQKLSVMQHQSPEKNDTNGAAFSSNASNLNHTSANESVRPLMPAEGRSSEQMLANANAPAPNGVLNVTLKTNRLSNSSQKYSTRPPIAGAGNESPGAEKPTTASYAYSSQDAMANGMDDDVKWNKLSSNSSETRHHADMMPSSSSGKDMDGQEQRSHSPCSSSGSEDYSENASRDELSSIVLHDNARLLNGSTEPDIVVSPLTKSKTKDSKCESSFLAPSSVAINASQSSANSCVSSSGHTSLNNNGCSSTSSSSTLNKGSIQSGEMEVPQQQQQQLNGADNGHVVNGRGFLPEEAMRINGHHPMANDNEDDLDDDKDTDVRLLSLAGNAVEVRSTVRLSGDGEQGL